MFVFNTLDKRKLSLSGLLVVVTVILTGALVRFTGILSAESCREVTEAVRAMHTEEVPLLNDHGKIVSFQSHVADDNTERAAGYQYICRNIIDTSTILFVYSQPVTARFHMRNVEAPLDIGFFDDKGKLFSVMLMQPYDDGDSRLYGPPQPFQYALEARQGFFADHNMSAGKSHLVPGGLYDSK